MRRPEISEGDWLVIRGSYPPVSVVGPVTRITAHQAQHPHRWRKDATQRSFKSDVLFAGTETACRSVAERLISSAALAEQEVCEARERHEARKAAVLASPTTQDERG